MQVSKLGLGCLGLTGAYNHPLDDEAGAAVVAHAFRRGVTFFDTSDYYGPPQQRDTPRQSLFFLLPSFLFLILGLRRRRGIALKQLPREQVQLATKFGLRREDAGGAWGVCSRPEYVRACYEARLRSFGLDYIDLYYQHRVDTTVPIEDTVGELKKLVEEGKIRYIGLSEASPDTIRRAHAVHPVSAVQMEWSLWSRDIEPEIVPLCRFFGGRGVTEVPAVSNLLGYPRFLAENLEKNKQIYLKTENLAKKHQCSSAQLALAWVLHQGDDVKEQKNIHMKQIIGLNNSSRPSKQPLSQI
ncbi:hypothetical protein C2845_PM04G11700 [Panicum miliaceum]|uniref:NADP-dependent oxidoreductase domain-containing protein n=1 Tax=Panicum miliaceum TaxID=4540 RepID=A0A3L6QVW9_PANMI|nr:hypothetical protein C2845_PM04G11700 [Panicum miliaceum]